MQASPEKTPAVREPYRSLEETALERVLREGLPAWVESTNWRGVWRTLAGMASLLTVVVGLLSSSPLLVALGVTASFIALACGLHKSDEVALLGRRLARCPVPVGELSCWIKDGTPRFGSIELVLRGPSPLAEAAVRQAEPAAEIRWPTTTTLRVAVPWSHRDSDVHRFERLVQLLAAHREELALEQIVLVAA